MSNPISSSVSYRNGDDNFGHVAFPIISFCFDDIQWVTATDNFKKRCMIKDSDQGYRDWTFVLRNCIRDQSTTTIAPTTLAEATTTSDFSYYGFFDTTTDESWISLKSL
jgi:hypothetical protein